MIRAAVIAATLLAPLLAAPAAHADSDPVDDSAAATCYVLRDEFTGDVEHDGNVTMGVAKAIAAHYDVSLKHAVHIINAQVENYCPSLWPELQAIGANARYNG